MVGPRRRELSDSFRLAVHGERWFLLDVLLAVVAFCGWIATTGALVALAGQRLGYSIALESGSQRTLAILSGAIIVWLLLPALAGTLRLRDRITNVSGNVEGAYRFDSPATLLGPPAVVVVIAWVATVVAPLKWPALALSLVAGAYLLARTTAYSYRVYSFGRPLVVHSASFVTLFLYAVVGVVQLAAVTDNTAMLLTATATLDVPIDPYATVGSGRLTVSLLMTVAAAAPVALSASYLALQAIAASIVRWRHPEVDRSGLRAGQRNPFRTSFAHAGRRVRQSAAASPASGAIDDGSTAPVHIQTTRVYAPDDDGISDRAGIKTAGRNRGGQHCRTCYASFSPGTDARFCPNCGQRLDHS